jgi:FdhD protein
MSEIPPGIERRQFTKADESSRQLADDYVAIEEPLQITIDGRPVAVLMRTPGREKDLAAGFCITEGLIDRFDDIGVILHCGSSTAGPDAEAGAAADSRNVVNITTTRQPASEHDPRHDVLRLVRSGCGRAGPEDLANTMAPLSTSAPTPQSVIAGLSREVLSEQETYRQAGGVHAVAIFDLSGALIAMGEDIGRHNAIDKAVGYCLMRLIPLGDKILYSTGRASYEMVAKAVRAGIPIMASRSSATTLAIDLAELLNCTLIGYARGDRMNIYTHPERVIP